MNTVRMTFVICLEKAKAFATQMHRLSICKPKFLSIWFDLIAYAILYTHNYWAFWANCQCVFFNHCLPQSILTYAVENMTFSHCSKSRNCNQIKDLEREKKEMNWKHRESEQKPFRKRLITFVIRVRDRRDINLLCAIECIVEVASATSDN